MRKATSTRAEPRHSLARDWGMGRLLAAMAIVGAALAAGLCATVPSRLGSGVASPPESLAAAEDRTFDDEAHDLDLDDEGGRALVLSRHRSGTEDEAP